MNTKTVEQLRDEGWAVILFSPEEIGRHDRELFEWNLGDQGAEMLDKLDRQPAP